MDAPDVLSEVAGSKTTRPERAGGILADRRKFPERGCDLRRHLLKLPREFIGGVGGAVAGCQAGRRRRVRGRTERMRAHVGDTGRLRGSPRRGAARWRRCRVRRTTGHEATPDLTGRGKLATREGPCPLDGVPRSVVCGGLGLEQRKYAFGAVGCPPRDQPTILFAQ